MKWLKVDRGALNETAFAALTTDPAPCTLTSERQQTRMAASLAKTSVDLPPGEIDNALATNHASMFVRKLNPSALAADEITAMEEARFIDHSRRVARSASPALQYGLWWHDFVQRLQWTNAMERRAELFEEGRELSPDPARSAREWKLLVQHVDSSEDFRKLVGEDPIAHAEMPFLWRLDGATQTAGRCLEGVIDLALFNRDANKCLILDWKTDRVPPDSTETLRARYFPQLAAYWKAISKMTNMETTAAIYSTAAGALVRYETAELEREWKRLEKLPPSELDSTIKPDPDRQAIVPQPNEPQSSLPKKPPSKPTQLEFPEL